ncbi:hypothetical protein SDC9_74247 [bioreactor metagenome]|uniref:Uncharacterized protein n=1 Tax=bioreactor metagenome TaxID=1076179 RepID=A0A644YNS6_9ZZZZ
MFETKNRVFRLDTPGFAPVWRGSRCFLPVATKAFCSFADAQSKNPSCVPIATKAFCSLTTFNPKFQVAATRSVPFIRRGGGHFAPHSLASLHPPQAAVGSLPTGGGRLAPAAHFAGKKLLSAIKMTAGLLSRRHFQPAYFFLPLLLLLFLLPDSGAATCGSGIADACGLLPFVPFLAILSLTAASPHLLQSMRYPTPIMSAAIITTRIGAGKKVDNRIPAPKKMMPRPKMSR